MATNVSPPFMSFNDKHGKPLEGGKIYIGEAGQNAETNPIQVFWDQAGAIPAAQPIITSGGYPWRSGSAANIFVGTSYSIIVKDKNGVLVFSSPINNVSVGINAIFYGWKNYVLNSNFEDGSSTGWNLGKDSGTTTPLSGGIGGGISGFLPLSIERTNPLSGSCSMSINKPASNIQGSTIYSNNMTIDREDINIGMELIFSYQPPLSGYSSSDYNVFLWDVIGGSNIPLSTNLLPDTSGQPGKFSATFSSNSNQVYRIVIMCVSSTNVASFSFFIDSVICRPAISISNALTLDGVNPGNIGKELLGLNASDDWSVVASVNNIQDLRDFPIVSITASHFGVKSLGYYAKGDISNIPEYTYVSGSPPGTYVDNGASIIVPTGGDGSSAYIYIPSEKVNAIAWGCVGDGVTDDTVRAQSLITFCRTENRIAYFPGGREYLITDTLNLVEGCSIEGDLKSQLNRSFAVYPGSTTFIFSPTSSKNFMVANGTNHTNFRLHYGLSGFYVKGNSVASGGNSNIGIYVDGVIYGSFKNVAFDGFNISIKCNRTINNRFENIYCNGFDEAIQYQGNNETTDVWEQCSFWGSPIGVLLSGSTIGLRFNNCLFEQLDNWGMDLCKETQNCVVTNAYCEDVPYSTAQATAAMFRVGHIGTTLITENHLIIANGVFSGRNAGVHGAFINANYSNGIMASGFRASRYVNVITTDTTNTRDNSVVLGGAQGISFTNFFTNVATKGQGFYPNGVINAGGQGQRATFRTTTVSQLITTDLQASQVNPTAGAFYPSTDNDKTLGLGSNRWSVVYAGTGTINTSDARAKRDIKEISNVEKLVAKDIVRLIKSFRFKDAFNEKGDGARIHFGVVAQEVVSALEVRGLDPMRYAFVCYDKWDSAEQVIDDDGKTELSPHREAGDRYGIRYEELLAFLIGSLF